MSEQVFSKRILITGGAGFIGSHVVRLFVTRNPDYKIIYLDALTYAGNLDPVSGMFSVRLNGDVGGYVPGLQDKLWWYGSARNQNIETQVPNFPVKPFQTRLRNLTGKLTYAASQNTKFTAYAQGGQKLQPTRTDRFLVAATVAALKEHPLANSSWTDDGILLHRAVHIGMATAIEDGLIVPVIKNADSLNLLGLCLLYTSDAAAERSSVNPGGPRTIKQKNKQKKKRGRA